MLPTPKQRIWQILDDHRPVDAKERADVAIIRQMVREHDDIFSRDCRAGHVTGSAVIMHLETGRFLLHFHKRLHRWLQVGGHMDDGETDPCQTAWREAREESALEALRFFPAADDPQPIDVDVHPIPAAGLEEEHLHLDFRYLLVTPDGRQGQVADTESHLFRWFSLDELQRQPELVDPSLMRCLRKAAQIKVTHQ